MIALAFAVAVLVPPPVLSPEPLNTQPPETEESVTNRAWDQTHEIGFIPLALRPKPKPAPKPSAPKPKGNMGMGSNVSQWDGIVAAYFGGEAWRASCLMQHESGGNPGARNSSSGAAGLMQIMPFWAGEYGVSYEALFDPETNIRIAKGIRDQQGWGAWSPYNRGLCR